MEILPEKNNLPLLHSCRNWSIENKCCKGFYDSIIDKRFEYVKVNIEDLHKDCKGKSNSQLCVWFLLDRRISYG
jgi:hypothetical protein